MTLDRLKLIIALAERDMTTVQLAALTKLSRGTISAIKNGKRCSTDTAQRIANALEISLEFLQGGEV